MRSRWAGLIIGLALIGALTVSGSAATGTVTVQQAIVGLGATQYRVDWTSSAGGAVSANAFKVKGGYIHAVKFVPCSGGTQPSDQYDATLVDSTGVDILDSQGLNLSNSAGAYVQFTTPFYFPGSGSSQTLDLVIANAGNAKCGVATLWVK